MGELAEGVIESLLTLSSSTVYLLVGVLCWAEAAFFLGFVTPGELAVAAGGILASRGQISLGWLVLVVIAGTTAGNTTGYWLGRRWGAGILESRVLQRAIGPSIQKARSFMERRGEWAIVLGRLATPLRIVVPFLVGASHVSYPRFLLFDIPATMVWAVTWTLLGFALGESWDVLQDVAGTAAFLVLVLLIVGFLIRWVAIRIAANQTRVQAAFRLLLTVTGTRGVARRLAPALFWLGRRLDPRLARGLSLTLGFTALMAAIGVVGLVLSQTRAVRGLVLLDFPMLEWMVAIRTDEAVRISRTGLRAFHWPGVLFLALLPAALLAWREGVAAALRVVIGMVGAGAGAYFLDRFVLEGVVPGAEFPSVPVAVAAALLVHTSATAARQWGWGASVSTAAVGTFVVCTIALATVVAGWGAPSGIVLGFALGMGWASAVELPGVFARWQADEGAEAGGPAPQSEMWRPSP